MELVFLAVTLFVALLFFWIGKQYGSVGFLFAAGGILLIAGLLVLGNGVSYYYPSNQTTTYSPDYFTFYNDSVTCINCSNASCGAGGGCVGTLSCSSLLDETNCTACDQCYWWEGACYTDQDGECALSETCEDCPECELTEADNTTFAPYCCEHDGNTTKNGSVIHTYYYSEREIGEEMQQLLGYGIMLIGLITLIGASVDFYASHGRRELNV